MNDFFRRLRVSNLLSYGDPGIGIALGSLNVLIGPNASGKSNLVEILGLLASLPRDLQKAIREGGGSAEWLWKGGLKPPGTAEVAVVASGYGKAVLHYRLKLALQGSRLAILEEVLEDLSHPDAVLVPKRSPVTEVDLVFVQPSVLEQIRDPIDYPGLTDFALRLHRIRLYRGWNLGRDSSIRRPQLADLPEDFLMEDGSNLALVLNDLENRPGVKRLLLEKLQRFYQGVENFTTKVQGGTVQIFFHEEGLSQPVSAARLSDGTLHYLCLLAILCHPSPPPLICIEEPEVGLHPDIIPEIAKLLLEASQRTQLVVTTHSEMLVSALSEVPEAIIVCERGNNGTQLRRLEPEKLKEWLESYTLGELWSMGEIGGNP